MKLVSLCSASEGLYAKHLFYESAFAFENCLLKCRKKCVSRKLLTLIVIIIIIIVHFFDCRQKKVLHKLDKKTQQKRGNIIYFYKSVIIFFIMLEVLSKLKNYHAGTLNKTNFLNICFA